MHSPEPGLLASLFAAERARDQGASEDLARLDCQSVVADATVAQGQYWDSAGRALAALVAARAPGSDERLARFRTFADGSPPRHPCRPSLTQERALARRLAERDPRTIEGALRVSTLPALPEDLDPSERAALDRLFAHAARW